MTTSTTLSSGRSGAPPTVEVRDLVARYGPRTILDGVSVAVRPAEIRVILGGSGSGKSTLLKHMIGMLAPAGGEVRLLGQDLTALDEADREQLLRRVGVLFQGSALLNSLTVHENVALPLRQDPSLPGDVIDEIVRMKLALVELAHAGPLYPSELSGGMKKRAGLARAMALDPEVLFCDEPSAGLDPITAAQLDELLINLRDRFRMSVVVVTHELASVELISDRVVMLHKGAIIADGSLGDVRSTDHPMVRAFFDRVAELEPPPPSVYASLGGEDAPWS
jgi:phospholipid/cholesterol/gamma-HCH transport system ATP-binding protein